MFANWPLLSLLVWVPFIGAALILITGNEQAPQRARYMALAVAIVNILLCIPLTIGFNPNTAGMQFEEHIAWITAYNINYDLGIDGISLAMILLTSFTTLVIVLAAWSAVKKNVAQYLAAFLVMQGMMVGVFVAMDAMLFYVFWEAMLIPMYLSIGIWGSSNRSYASIKFFLYTFLGSALMLVAILYMGIKAGTFNIVSLYGLPLSMTEQTLIFLAFFLAFAVKVPMWPVHTWLPDAHTEAPAGGSVVLAALLLKMGVYGFLRFNLPITPDASQALDWMMIVLSLIAVVYIGIVAIVQKDMKRLIAYSSIAHMGFATLACFMIYIIVGQTGNLADAYMAIEGSMVLMISHALSSGAMFLGIGMLYDRMHTRQINDFGGVAHKMPAFAAFYMLFAMSNVGLPGTSGFVGEFMILLSTFRASFWVTFFAGTTLILAAAYTLWMYKRVFFGEIKNEKVNTLTDATPMEFSVLAVLALGIVFLGVYPEPLLNILHVSVAHILKLSLITKLG